MNDAMILKAGLVALSIWLCFGVSAESAGGKKTKKNISPKQNSSKKIQKPFDLKATRYWKLLGMSKSEVIKELTGDEEERDPMTLLVYKDYAEGVRDVQDMRDTVEVVFKDDKATMVRERFTYFTGYSSHQTEWYDSNGIIKPQPIIKDQTGPATLMIEDGMDIGSYLDEVRRALLKNFDSASACNDLKIAVEIKPDGSVESAEVLTSSGDATLDKKALDAFKATKFPPLYGSHKSRSMGRAFTLKLFLSQPR